MTSRAKRSAESSGSVRPAKRPQGEDKYVVRFPDGMRDRVKASAEANRRSMNAEIVSRLTASFAERPQVPATESAGSAGLLQQKGISIADPLSARETYTADIPVSATTSLIGWDIVAGLDIDRLDRLTTIVDRTRLALGTNAARELWSMLGLPLLRTSSKRAAPRESEPDLLSRLDDAGSGGALPTSTDFQPFEAKLPREYVAEFMRECCERDPEAETSARVFRQGYVAWADRRGAPVPMACVLGKYAIGLGLRKRKVNGSSIYLGLRIRPQEVRSGAAAGV